MNIKLDLYGAFRQLGVNNFILDVPVNSTVGSLRQIVKGLLKDNKAQISEQLIQMSVFATDESILKDTDALIDVKSLSLLPPVCGG